MAEASVHMPSLCVATCGKPGVRADCERGRATWGEIRMGMAQSKPADSLEMLSDPCASTMHALGLWLL